MSYAKNISLLSLFSFAFLMGADFDTQWCQMQKHYAALSATFQNNKRELQNYYVLPDWEKYQVALAHQIEGRPNPRFTRTQTFLETMVRQGMHDSQQTELNYLNYFLNDKNRNLISRFQDTNFGGIPFDCSQKQCSVNALGQLFYFAKIIHQKKYETIHSMLEFGGGFGTLCRISKQLLPDVTYAIIDLPEFLCIQYLYLSMTLENPDIIMHHSAPVSLTKGAIHLIPVYLLDDLDIHVDVFVSPFALSECPVSTQEAVCKKHFFNANLAYLTGQMNGWGTPENHGIFRNQSTVVHGIQNTYSHSFYHPFHEFYGGTVCSYEIIGEK